MQLWQKTGLLLCAILYLDKQYSECRFDVQRTNVSCLCYNYTPHRPT